MTREQCHMCGFQLWVNIGEDIELVYGIRIERGDENPKKGELLLDENGNVEGVWDGNKWHDPGLWFEGG